MELVTINKLHNESGLGYDTVIKLLAKAGVEPISTVVIGSQNVRLFDAEPAAKAIAAHKAERAKPKAAAPAPAAAAAAEHVPLIQKVESIGVSVDLALTALDALPAEFILMRESLAKIGATIVGAIDARIDTLEASAAKTHDQNVLLLRAIDGLKETMLTRIASVETRFLAALKATERAAPAAQVVAVPPPAPGPVVPAPVAAPGATAKNDASIAPPAVNRSGLPRILIVGLTAPKRQEIEREFKDAFSIKFYDATELRSTSFHTSAVNALRVFCMKEMVNTGITPAKNAAGSRLVMVSGNGARLRDELLSLFTGPDYKRTA